MPRRSSQGRRQGRHATRARAPEMKSPVSGNGRRDFIVTTLAAVGAAAFRPDVSWAQRAHGRRFSSSVRHALCGRGKRSRQRICATKRRSRAMSAEFVSLSAEFVSLSAEFASLSPEFVSLSQSSCL